MTARRISELDPHPTAAQLREMFRQKTGRDVDDMARVVLDLSGHPAWESVTVANHRTGVISAAGVSVDGVRRAVVGDALTAERTLTAGRTNDTLTLTLGFAPRTKKGHTTLGIRQSPQYRKYRDDIKTVIGAVRDRLGLPLPPKPQTYNLCAVYYVDCYGKTADLFGLHDGLADALQNAGVVASDWQFRTSDGSRIVFDDPIPRVEIVITRLEP